MNHSPSFAVPPTFIGIDPGDCGSPICIAGIPLDVGTTNRRGARFGPAAIRHASRMLADGDHPQHWVDASSLPVADIGNFAIALGDIPRTMALIEEQAAGIEHLVALGGDHNITLPLLRSLAKKRPPLAVIHFDAHLHTWPDDFGQVYGHGSVFFHAIQERFIEPRWMVQIGIRSPVSREVHDWTAERVARTITAEEVHEAGPLAVAETIRGIIGEASVYLSFDIDAFDPVFAPETATPEIGGLATWQAKLILRRSQGLNLVGTDVVEIAPAYDIAEITALAGATMAWEYLYLLRLQVEG